MSGAKAGFGGRRVSTVTGKLAFDEEPVCVALDSFHHDYSDLGWGHLMVKDVLKCGVKLTGFDALEKSSGKLVAARAGRHIVEEVSADDFFRLSSGQIRLCLVKVQDRTVGV